MALTERPTLSPDAKEALLARLRRKYADDEPSDDVGPDNPGHEPDRSWLALGIELEEVHDTVDVADAGRDTLARMVVLLERHRPAWQRDALCIEYADTVTWFPTRGESVQPAKDVCARCLVAEECHAYASEIDAPAGIWAGTSARSRHPVIGEATRIN